ncbi:MAG: DNA replication/repair protein RecF [Clostridia bacterium]|nr:DNA replication/repair protein RecF [Clostridia bacterium]
MILKSISYTNIRNLQNTVLIPSENITVFTGENAQGKTNILEGIHICCTGRSHRTSKDNEVIKIGKEMAYLDIQCQKRDGIHRVEIALKNQNRKAISINGYPAKRLGELMGQINCVMFSPEDLSLITSGPQYRRKFIDIALSQINPKYFYALQNYQKVIAQRNNLLKSLSTSNKNIDTLSVWDEQLCDYGSQIYILRKEFIENINKKCSQIHSHISGGRENLSILFMSNIKGSTAGEAYEVFLNLLKKNHAVDIRRQITQIGIHRDDIKLMLDDIDVRTQGSQGQKRTTALSLKFSEIEIMKEYSGELPVLLLDDVFSELDKNRRKWLLKYIKDIQTFITCVDIESTALQNEENIKIVKVVEGKLQ